jgi:hypothetical protein
MPIAINESNLDVIVRVDSDVLVTEERGRWINNMDLNTSLSVTDSVDAVPGFRNEI